MARPRHDAEAPVKITTPRRRGSMASMAAFAKKKPASALTRHMFSRNSASISRKAFGQFPPALKIAASRGASTVSAWATTRRASASSGTSPTIASAVAPAARRSFNEASTFSADRPMIVTRKFSLPKRRATAAPRPFGGTTPTMTADFCDMTDPPCTEWEMALLTGRRSLPCRARAADAQAAHVEPLTGVLVDHNRTHFMTGLMVYEHDGRAFVIPQPIAAPPPHGGQHVPKCATLVSEPVLVAHRSLGRGPLLHHPIVHQTDEPLGEHGARDAKGALELFEAATAQEGLTQHERRPPVTDQVRGPCDGARPAMEARTTHQATSSIRAGTCLCHGVPASQSRCSEAVSSFGATPWTTARPLSSGYESPRPFGRLTCPGCIHSFTSTTASALPRQVVTRTRPPSGTPSDCASRAHIRSAPAISFLRHAGSRKIVFAVPDRRSPAVSTKGNSRSRSALSSRSVESSGSSSGTVKLRRPSGGASRRQVSSYSSIVNVTPERPARIASNSASPNAGPSPSRPARRTDCG